MILLNGSYLLSGNFASGFDQFWFGIIASFTVETGLISPPVGMNLFCSKKALLKIEMMDCMIGVTPFVLADVCSS